MEKEEEEGVACASVEASFNRIPSAVKSLLIHLTFGLVAVDCGLVRSIIRGVLQSRLQSCSHPPPNLCAVMNALGAIALGAPVGTQCLQKTIQWCCMMSAFTVVPAGSVFGSSWSNWQRIFAFTKSVRSKDFMICVPAHGAILGAWFGAWPMPLDWERPWQDWPVCVSYGAMLGYVLGMLGSVGFIFLHDRQQRIKVD